MLHHNINISVETMSLYINHNPKGKRNEINLINSMAVHVGSWPSQLRRTFSAHGPCRTGTGHVYEIMYTCQWLDAPKYHRYGQWLQEQDADTLQTYFGSAGPGIIESLMLRIEAEPDQHAFLVAANCDGWLGTLHIAEVTQQQVEFGLIVHRDHRGLGIGSDLLTQGITWARNRGYTELFMHCLSHNAAVKHLCHQHGLEPRDLGGDSETKIALAPATWITVNQELVTQQRNLFYMALQQTWPPFQETFG